jgi:SUMO ligase MMS21 Smc5/6 complex component
MSEILVDIRNEGLQDVFGGDTVSIRELINAVKDLKCELMSQEEHYEDEMNRFKEEIHDFYKEKSPYEVYGLNEADFH